MKGAEAAAKLQQLWDATDAELAFAQRCKREPEAYAQRRAARIMVGGRKRA